MTQQVKPVLVVSFDDPADVRRAYEALRRTFRCDYEDGGILVTDRDESGRWTIEHDERADQAYRELDRQVSAEIQQAESSGLVPTLNGRHHSRPDPNALMTYARVAAWMLVEDPAGGEAGRRVAALEVVAAFNDRLRELGLEAHVIPSGQSRKLYTALRGIVPGLRVEPSPSGNRMYISGVDWSPEAKAWRNLPEFKPPYAK